MLFILIFSMTSLSSCYNNHKHKKHGGATLEYSEKQLDSISFQSNHHYTNNYNFIVKADSIKLIEQLPEEATAYLTVIDTVTVYHNENLVVADIKTMPNDAIDSVWVKVAHDQKTMGWIHESELLPNVVPDDPISEFISTFSDIHLLIFLIIIAVIVISYIMRKLLRKNAYIVHFRDISSFYPAMLCIIVACSATFYASMQTFAPEVWRHFYFHPTLNPFSVPTLLSIFLVSVWAILIVGIAAVDDTLRLLPLGDAILYLEGLAGFCAINYIIFSITTLYYVGYILLVAYVYFAVKHVKFK